MLVADGNGLPMGFELANASRHEVKLAVSTLQTMRVPRAGRGRPKQRPKELVADKAYDSKGFRNWLRARRIKPTIPSYERRERQRPKRGRPLKVGPGYSERWKVERTFAWLAVASAGCWCGMSATFRPSERSSWSRSFSSR